MTTSDIETDAEYYEAQLADVRRANASLCEHLKVARDGSKLIDRMGAPTVFVLPDGRGVMVGGRYHGWLVWRHADGQWVTLEKLPTERAA